MARPFVVAGGERLWGGMQDWQQVLAELVSDRLTSLKRLSVTVAAVAAIAVTVPVALGHSSTPVGNPRHRCCGCR